jgi:hypothetical protein
VKSFINAGHPGATSVNIESGFQKPENIPDNSLLPLESQCAMDPPDPQILEIIRIGTKVNEKILTCTKGLNFLCQQEYRRLIVKAG